MDGRIQIVIQIAEIFKNSRLIVRLRKQIVDVKKLNALRIAPVSEIADTVRVHDLIGYRVLRGMGLAVTAIFTNDGFNLFSFGAGELGLVRHAFCFRAVCSFRQSPLPPVPFDIDTQGRRMR